MPPKKTVKPSSAANLKKPSKSREKEVPKKLKVSRPLEEPPSSKEESEIIEVDELEEVAWRSEVKPKKTSPYMSIYEYTALIRARALQLGAPDVDPDIPTTGIPEDFDPINIATKDIRENRTTFIIRRTLTDGTIEDWYPKDMVFPRM